MYEIMPETTPEVLAIRIKGSLDKADYERLGPWLDARLAEHAHPAMLFVMDDFEGWDSLGALIEDVKLDIKHHDDLSRVAIVGDRAWQKWMTWLGKPFTSAELRYFERDDLDAARVWAERAARAA
jgi:hypothetical protein